VIHRTTELVKFKKLKRRLGFDKQRDVVGLLESLWLFTQRNCPRGDVGKKHDNEAIAIELEWDGDPDALVSALLDCGWLDPHPDHRLVVHDWHKHCPRYIHAQLKSQDWTFASTDSIAISTVPPIERPIDQPIDRPTDATTEGGIPNLTKPDLTQPDKTKSNMSPSGDVDASKEIHFPDFFEQFWNAYPKRGGKRRGKLKAFNIWKTIPAADRNLVIKAAKNYQTEEYIRDPERFLASDWWRDWIDPAELQESNLPPLVVPDDFNYVEWCASNAARGQA
jgi:hypothetical protein